MKSIGNFTFFERAQHSNVSDAARETAAQREAYFRAFAVAGVGKRPQPADRFEPFLVVPSAIAHHSIEHSNKVRHARSFRLTPVALLQHRGGKKELMKRRIER